ncbi:uncharacterized protein [Branchiostoma lanceolatum]|uniref:uncharacterized protein n=1 Tax=Branchiostoma lanceolatum TaxID=7740 RepID=UPI0034561423
MPTRYAVKITCPIAGCPGQGRLNGWVCAQDGGTIYVDEDGYLSCQTMAHRAKIIYWRFDCGDRSSGSKHNYHKYQSPDLEGFTHGLAVGLPHFGAAEAAWLTKLIQAVEAQFRNGC